MLHTDEVDTEATEADMDVGDQDDGSGILAEDSTTSSDGTL